MRPDDWPAVRAIYEEGIATGHATFQTSAPSWEHRTSNSQPPALEMLEMEAWKFGSLGVGIDG
jgi:L-amino acid N-acyltransferase YncA